MNKNLKHTVLTLFPSAVCNLNCTYCNISKNKALIEIDKELEDFFNDPDYIMTRVHKYFEPCALTTLETWGGEPFLHMDRIYKVLPRLVEDYPYLQNFFSSTNFSFPNWIEQFFGLMHQFKQWPDRQFNYKLQISCDGPTELNDLGRGKGTTLKCLENYARLVESLESRLPANVNLSIVPKPTLNLETVRLLNTKEKIIEYYQFFEDCFINLVNKLKFSNVQAYTNTPNIGVPCPATKEDGLYFAKFAKNCAEVSKHANKYFKYYTNVRPFSIYEKRMQNLTFYQSGIGCGMGYSNIGLLPQDKISVCNEGFVQTIKQYNELRSQEQENGTIEKKTRQSKNQHHLCYSDDEYEKFEEQMCNFCYTANTSVLVGLCNQITLLALSGQIDKQYIQQPNALHAAQVLAGEYFCLKDNYDITGSFSLIPVGLIRLLLNGALPYLENNDENI